ncbi:MAG: 50S ribosomal protein L6 [Pseudohongiellaceae bacterium]|jgi:large subunit ribosomal protein L6
MSRIANAPVDLPSGVQVNITDSNISVKGGNGSLELALHELVSVVNEDNQLKLSARKESKEAVAMTGTFRSLVSNMVTGVSDGFERKLELVGVGYRAKAQGKTLNLVVGYSHPIDYTLPEGITAETPTQTEIVIKGADKQMVGQVAAEIRKFRPPEPYKGKGIRYANERVFRKEAKKK